MILDGAVSCLVYWCICHSQITGDTIYNLARLNEVDVSIGTHVNTKHMPCCT